MSNHHHQWEAGGDGWGVVPGVSRCKVCKKTATEADFPEVYKRAKQEEDSSDDRS